MTKLSLKKIHNIKTYARENVKSSYNAVPSQGEVFIVQNSSKGLCWISCKVCKKKFERLEKFLSHFIKTHLKDQTDQIRGASPQNSSEKTNIIDGENNNNLELPSTNNEELISNLKSFEKNIENIQNKLVNENVEAFENIDGDVENTQAESSELNIDDELNINHKLDSDHKLDINLPLGDDSEFLENNELESNIKKKFNNEKQLCPQCGKIYLTTSSLNHHIKTHFEPTSTRRSFKCEECGTNLTSKTGLQIHMRIHSGEKPEKCSLCPKAYRTRTALKVHFTTHTGQLRFPCSFCEKRFRIKAQLQIHERVHTDDKPVQCDVCGARFRCTSAMNVHRRQHQTHAEKKFQCKLCSVYISKNLREYHRKTHEKTKNYSCLKCSECFRTQSSLRCHLFREHRCAPIVKKTYLNLEKKGLYKLGEIFREVSDIKEIVEAKNKTFKCGICSSGHTTEKSLKMHERVHAETKDYKCDVCGSECFRTYGDLHYHMRRKHACTPKANSNYTLIGGRRRK